MSAVSRCDHDSFQSQMNTLKMQEVAVFICLTFPWLNPFASGPSPAVTPWLISVAALSGILAVVSWQKYSNKAGVVRGAACSPQWIFLVALGWLVAGMVSSFIGILQYFGPASVLDPWIAQTFPGEAFANLRQRNQFASLTNIALAALIWFAVKLPSFPDVPIQTEKRRLVLLLLAAGLLVTGTAASSSRTGLVQLFLLLALCGLWGVWRLRPVRSVLIVAVMTYGVAMVALPWAAGFDLSLHGMAARLHAGDTPCASRITLWSNVLHLIAQKPWLGWGWGELDYAHYITLYDGPRFCEILDNAHNLPLQLAVELGVPAALLVCGAFMWWVLRQRPWRETNPTRQLAWSVLAVILLHSMLEYPLWYGPFQMAFGLCLVLLWRARASKQGTEISLKNTNITRLMHVSRALLATFLIAGAGYAVWDYQRISQIYLAPEQRDAAYRSDTLAKIQGSWLFASQVDFARLLLTPLTRDNARWTFDLACALLHYSPEPRIIEKTIESAVLLGLDNEALVHLARYQAAFPKDYARWAQNNAQNVAALKALKLGRVSVQ